jgi:23S rRNA (cytosine1962-C5)-methyltransferase
VRAGDPDPATPRQDDAVSASAPDHELLDAGDGRRLDRFGSVVVDRPAPGAVGRPRGGDRWRQAQATFDRASGWRWSAPPPDPWLLRLHGVTVELRPADGGQVGVFPEHASMWPWLADRSVADGVLHLFAYTGATTLALAAIGAPVTHVDAARTVVAWARANAERSGLAAAPIRWIVDDAAAFVGREVRRRRRYAGIVLDPPTYGHGTGGRRWAIDRDLHALLEGCVPLLARPGFILLTAHTPDHGPERLGRLLEAAVGSAAETGSLELHARSGVTLRLGAFARWARS